MAGSCFSVDVYVVDDFLRARSVVWLSIREQEKVGLYFYAVSEYLSTHLNYELLEAKSSTFGKR